MKSTIRLFKAIPVQNKRKKKPTKALLEKTLKRGFVFSPEVVFNYKDFDELISLVEEEVGLTPEKMNQTFHKTWKKVRDTKIEQLIIEQLIHYFTTYGFKSLGIYSEESVYIPAETLEIPGLKEGEVKVTVIKGYTKKELKEKLMEFLSSGIALDEDTISDVLDVANLVNLKGKDIELIKNREVKIALYHDRNMIPEDPVEFLRYLLYKTTGSTLIVKSDAVIEAIKVGTNIDTVDLFAKYNKEHGFRRLAEIFYRHKPIFLAFRSFETLRPVVNKIRRMARTYHKPFKQSFLDSVTSRLERREKIDSARLTEELEKVNIFRKVRLAYALKFRTGDSDSIVYRVRNGKSYATDFSFTQRSAAKKILTIIEKSIVETLKKNVKGKKIYIPENIRYAVPSTGRQFTGNFPSGSYVSVPKDMVFGVHWENAGKSIDLDLSLIDVFGSKYGWDSDYRSEDKTILFSGDITDAPKPRGATELFYVRRQEKVSAILYVNYYNFDPETEVPFKILVAKEQVSNFGKDYMVNPNNVAAVTKTNIKQRQKILGLLISTTNECRFYFAEAYLGNSITSTSNEFSEHARKFLIDYYENTINLNEMLKKAGAKLVKTNKNCDIDLSPTELEKTTILELMK